MNAIIGPALVGKVHVHATLSFFYVVVFWSCIKYKWYKLSKYYMALAQDPTEQTQIDNYMVQQLDGTSNEWGWCKQKVPFFLLMSTVQFTYFYCCAILANYFLRFLWHANSSLVRTQYWRCHLLCAKQGLVSKKFPFIRYEIFIFFPWCTLILDMT